MSKYMKDPKFKKPRNKSWEEKEPKYKKKSNKEYTKRSSHRHEYESCIVREHYKGYVFLTFGKRCKYCNRVIKEGLLMTAEIPEKYIDLPVVETGDINDR